jgi:hypothetical protein
VKLLPKKPAAAASDTHNKPLSRRVFAVCLTTRTCIYIKADTSNVNSLWLLHAQSRDDFVDVDADPDRFFLKGAVFVLLLIIIWRMMIMINRMCAYRFMSTTRNDCWHPVWVAPPRSDATAQ